MRHIALATIITASACGSEVSRDSPRPIAEPDAGSEVGTASVERACDPGASCPARAPSGVVLAIGGARPERVIEGGRDRAPARLVSTPEILSFGEVVVDRPVTPARIAATVTVTNAGERPSGALDVAITGSADFTADGCAGSVLAPGASCAIALRFDPRAPGEHAATLAITARPGGDQTIELTGTGVTTQLAIDPPFAAFPAIVAGEVGEPVSFAITNTTDEVTAPLDVVTGDGFAIDPSEDACAGASLARGERCTVQVAFAPDVAGTAAAELVVSSPTSGVVRAALTGDALAPAHLVIAPAPEDFGPVRLGDDAVLTLTVDNVGDEPTGPMLVDIGDSLSFWVVANRCPARLQPLQGCTVDVRFRPTKVGEATATLDATATPGGTATADLFGEGALPEIRVSAAVFDFDALAVGDLVTEAFIVDNVGPVASDPLALSLTGPNADDFAAGDDCGALGPQASCTVTVAFEPAAVGPRSASLEIGGEARIDFAGAGLARLMLADADGDDEADFGPAIIATTLPPEAAVVITNRGASARPLAITPSFGAPAAFAVVSNGCADGPTIAPGASCTVRVSFTPTAPGPRTGSLAFSIGAAATDRAVWRLAGSGIESLVLRADGSFGEVPRNTIASLVVAVENPPGAPTTGPLAVRIDGIGFAIATESCSGGTLAATAACEVHVIFAPTRAGPAAATLTVTGAPGGSPAITLSATGVDPIGTAPTEITLVPGSVLENAPAGTAVGELDTYDIDPAEAFSYVIVAGGADFALDGERVSTRRPFDREATATRPLRVRVTDAGGQVFESDLTVFVQNVDEPTVVTADSATVWEDAPATSIDVLANDADPDSTLGIVSVTQPPHGVVLIAADRRTLNYRPAPDYCTEAAPDAFSYKVPGGLPGVVAVAVTCVDDPAVAMNDTADATEGGGPVEIDVLANDLDPDGDLRIASVTQPLEGLVAIGASGGGIIYAPATDASATTDVFSYTLAGGSTATVTVAISLDPDGAFIAEGVVTLPRAVYYFTTIDIPADAIVGGGDGGVLELYASGDVVIAGAIALSGEAARSTTGPCRFGGGGGGADAFAAGRGGGGFAGGGGAFIVLYEDEAGGFGAGGARPGYGGAGPTPYAGADGLIALLASGLEARGPGGGGIGADAALDLGVFSTFRSGSGGGGGANGTDAISAATCGGGGGGALRIVSATRITLVGTLEANGGGGARFDDDFAPSGGGSGGVIVLVAPALELHGQVLARGGAGVDGWGGAGGLGRIRLSVDPDGCLFDGTFDPPLESGCTASPPGGTLGFSYLDTWPD